MINSIFVLFANDKPASIMETIAYSYIRFSTPEQLKGDSLRRQLDASKMYADRKGWPLDDSLNLHDKGLSAFHGVHKQKGKLGEFLELIRHGKLVKGSDRTILMVEEFDRLSREELRIAHRQFEDILEAGVDIAITKEDRIFTKDSLNNPIELITSIMYMAQAHEESRIKSERLKSTWEQKRKEDPSMAIRLGRKSAKTPAWIRLSDDGQEYVKDPEVCKAIRKIYQLRLNGYGAAKIETFMNAHPEFWSPPPSKRKSGVGGWRKSYIIKLLYDNRQLIGEYQPHQKINGKRVPVGDPIPDYFPAAIPKSLFDQVQDVIHQNSSLNGMGGGRTGKGSNLFPHIAVCGLCGAPMTYKNHGNSPKSGPEKLWCDASRRKLLDEQGERKCIAKTVNYQELLGTILDNLQELPLEQMFSGSDDQEEIKKIDDQIATNNVEIRNRGKSIENIQKLIDRHTGTEEGDISPLELYDRQIMGHLTAIKELKKETERLHLLREGLRDEARKRHGQLDNIKAVRRHLEKCSNEEERIKIRLQLREALRKTIESITVLPLMSREERITYLEKRIKEVEEKFKDEPKRPKLWRKGAIATGMMREEIEQLKRPEEEYQSPEPGVVRKIDSKYIDRIDIRFRGPGIMDHEDQRMIQRRTVRLDRYVFTEAFQPKGF